LVEALERMLCIRVKPSNAFSVEVTRGGLTAAGPAEMVGRTIPSKIPVKSSPVEDA
jgi:hypothetical protein